MTKSKFPPSGGSAQGIECRPLVPAPSTTDAIVSILESPDFVEVEISNFREVVQYMSKDGHSCLFDQCCSMSASTLTAAQKRTFPDFAIVPILLQKSEIARR
jgi:hypothetical protein